MYNHAIDIYGIGHGILPTTLIIFERSITLDRFAFSLTWKASEFVGIIQLCSLETNLAFKVKIYFMDLPRL